MTPTPPFHMKPSRRATLTHNGVFHTAGRASFVWQCFLEARASGIPGDYKIRADEGKPWHTLNFTIEEAEDALAEWGMYGGKKVVAARARRVRRRARDLPVA